jgi:hypothetical protein
LFFQVEIKRPELYARPARFVAVKLGRQPQINCVVVDFQEEIERGQLGVVLGGEDVPGEVNRHRTDIFDGETLRYAFHRVGYVLKTEIEVLKD